MGYAGLASQLRRSTFEHDPDAGKRHDAMRTCNRASHCGRPPVICSCPLNQLSGTRSGRTGHVDHPSHAGHAPGMRGHGLCYSHPSAPCLPASHSRTQPTCVVWPLHKRHQWSPALAESLRGRLQCHGRWCAPLLRGLPLHGRRPVDGHRRSKPHCRDGLPQQRRPVSRRSAHLRIPSHRRPAQSRPRPSL